MKPIFPDCQYPDDCQCAVRGYEHERTNCAVPRVRAAVDMLFSSPPAGVEIVRLDDPAKLHDAIARAIGEAPPGLNVGRLAEAYIKVAEANHYLVQVVQNYTEDDLDEAEQLLIRADNDKNNADPVLNLALDILEQDRKDMRYHASRKRNQLIGVVPVSWFDITGTLSARRMLPLLEEVHRRGIAHNDLAAVEAVWRELEASP